MEKNNEEESLQIEKIINDLSVNFKGDINVLKDIYEEVRSIAFNISRMKNTEDNKNELFPYIKRAVKAEYLARGGEGLKSRGEGSVSNSFEDIVEKLRNDIIKNGLRRLP